MTDFIKNHGVKFQLGTLVTVIIFIIGITVSVINAKRDIEIELATMNNQYNHCLKFYNTLEKTQSKVVEDNQKQDLIIVEIKTKLSSIESILLELKEKIK